MVGLGYAHNTVAYMGSSNSSWMANVGAGAQYLVNDTFGLQADLRQVWSEADVGTVGATSSTTLQFTDFQICNINKMAR